jgi:hypothetical protein
MKLSNGLIIGAIILGSHLSFAQVSYQPIEILNHYLEINRPDYFTFKNRAQELRREIQVNEDAGRLSQNKQLQKELIYYENHTNVWRKDASYKLENRENRDNTVSSLIQRDKDFAVLRDEAAAHGRAEQSAYLNQWLLEQKSAQDAHDALLRANQVNADPKVPKFALINEKLKGQPGFITELELTKAEKAKIVDVMKDYNDLKTPFKGSSPESVFGKLKVISNGKIGPGEDSNSFVKKLQNIDRLMTELDSARSKEELLAKTAELDKLMKPSVNALKLYFAREYSITFGAVPIVQRDGKQVVLDEVGNAVKVVGPDVFKEGKFVRPGKVITGKEGVRKALIGLGLSSIAVSSMASEVETPDVVAPTKGFSSHDWAIGAK